MSDFLNKEINKEMLKIAKGLAEKEALKAEADSLMTNRVAKYEEEIKRLKGDVERLAEENSNYEIISKSHKELNGELQKELDEVKADNKKLAKQIEDMQQNYIKIDGKR
jgi:septal ring factor EnvC (AmiA/AmiB activator)